MDVLKNKVFKNKQHAMIEKNSKLVRDKARDLKRLQLLRDKFGTPFDFEDDIRQVY